MGAERKIRGIRRKIELRTLNGSLRKKRQKSTHIIKNVDIIITMLSLASIENHSRDTFKPLAKERFGGHIPGIPDPYCLVF
jgi:hypothetical protein